MNPAQGASGQGSQNPSPGATAGTTGGRSNQPPATSAGSAAPTATAGTSGGAAGTTASGGGPSAAVCAMLPTPANMDDIVSTFEDGKGNVNQTASRGGGFYMFNDGTGTQMPPTGSLPPARMESRCGTSMFAMCMSGSGFMTWGAGMGTDLGKTAMSAAAAGASGGAAGGGAAGSGAAGGGGAAAIPASGKTSYDASMYKGISFWAKANAGSALALRVSVKDKNTAPEGGVCDAKVTSGGTACNDDWGKGLTLTTEWAPYTLLWTDLRQAGWGAMYPAFQSNAAYSIQFQVNQGLSFDVCIDDLAFVR